VKKTFFLIRHAESMGNVGMDNGCDPGLTPQGHAQARKCGEFMAQFCDAETQLLSSPFLRCVTTSKAIAEANGLKIRLVPALHELFLREWFPPASINFSSLREIAENHPLVIGKYDEIPWWPEDGETEFECIQRLAMFRNRLLGSEFPEDKIICVGHWASIEALTLSFCPEIHIPPVSNAGVTKIEWDGRKANAEMVCETSFLGGII